MHFEGSADALLHAGECRGRAHVGGIAVSVVVGGDIGCEGGQRIMDMYERYMVPLQLANRRAVASTSPF